MGQALQRAVDLRGGHQLGFFDDAHGRVILAQASEGIEVRQTFLSVALVGRRRPEREGAQAKRQARLPALAVWSQTAC
jgi:hypothetical protein